MAVIKAVSSKAGIGHAIDYVTKKEKTEEKPVSYTHLDVYKRQEEKLVSGLHCEPETVKEEMQATKAVSYTHLDVYKRQPQRSCGARRTEEPISIMCNPTMRTRK